MNKKMSSISFILNSVWEEACTAKSHNAYQPMKKMMSVICYVLFSLQIAAECEILERHAR